MQYHMERALYSTIYTLVVLYQKSHSFAVLTCSISVTSTTRSQIPYARTLRQLSCNLHAHALIQN